VIPYVITRLCVDCVDGACVDICPVDCIVAHRPPDRASELPNQLFINPEECIGCGACMPQCPWEAIFSEDDVPAELSDDIALNAESARRAQEFVVLRLSKSHQPPSARSRSARPR
jgi:ferredoxin